MWNEKLELPEGSYCLSDIQDQFEHITKKLGESANTTPKRGYFFETLTSATMNLLGRTESKITKDKNGENVTHLEIA